MVEIMKILLDYNLNIISSDSFPNFSFSDKFILECHIAGSYPKNNLNLFLNCVVKNISGIKIKACLFSFINVLFSQNKQWFYLTRYS